MMFKLLVLASLFTACGKKADAPADKPADKVAADKPAADKPATDKPADKPAANPAGGKGGCSFITEAEASEVLGQPSKYRSDDGSDNCIIDPVAEASATTTSVDFTAKAGSTGSYDYWATNAAMKPLEGLGDKALHDPSAPLMRIVAVVKGKNEVVLTFSGAKAADTAVVKAFTQKVLAHF